jgi:hypothetical protein
MTYYFAVFTFGAEKVNQVAHREGRTRSLKISGTRDCHCRKSLTLYPIELGGHIYFPIMHIHKREIPSGKAFVRVAMVLELATTFHE